MEEKAVEKVVDNALPTNVSLSQIVQYNLGVVPTRRWIGVGATLAAAIYLYYYTRDDRKYAYERKYWVRRIINTVWFPREGESFLESLFSNFLKVPENVNIPPPWHYLEVKYQPPLLEEQHCKHYEAYLDGMQIYDRGTYYIMQALRIFGHFDKETLCEILQASQIHYVREGGTLFGIGHRDECAYVVLHGKIDILLLDTLSLFKRVTEGGQLVSVISLIACVTGQPLVHRGLEAKAKTDTDVVSIPYEAIFNAMKKRPDRIFYLLRRTLERVMGVTLKVMLRLMGLNKELIDDRSKISRFEDFDMEIGEVKNKEVIGDALRGVQNLLQIEEDHSHLLENCTVTVYGTDARIEIATPDCADLIYVHAGEVKATGLNGLEFFVIKGECFGGILLMTNFQGLFSLRVPNKAVVVKIPFPILEKVFTASIMSSIIICRQIVTRLSWFTMMFSLGVEWRIVEHQTILFSQGEKSHSVYLILSGRLRSVSVDETGKESEIGEVGKGDWVGLFEAVTNTIRRKSYIATRDSELAVVPASLLEYSKYKFPKVATNIFEYICSRLAKNYISADDQDILVKSNTTASTSVFVLPVSGNIPMSVFGLEILKHHKLGRSGTIVSPIDARKALKKDLDKDAQFELSAWATRLEELYLIVIYLGDPSAHYYNLRCILQADRVLVVADPSKSSPNVTDLEKLMLKYAPLAKKDLILIYKKESPTPRGTKDWIKPRPWIIRHHHIRFEKEFFNYPGFASEQAISQGYPGLTKPIYMHSDMSRLIRWFTGKSIALVIGGGGAKGAAHIGFLRTLLSLNLPVDMLAGVSIGSLICAHLSLYERDVDRLERDIGRWFKGMAKWWAYIFDSGFIFRALITGESFNQSLQQILGGIQIEDLWTPYFCVSTDMTGKCARPHYHGNLWEYVRASMNLVGYFEPYRDPIDGHYLMDGGYIQLVPVDFMRHYGAHYVLAMDISSGKGISTVSYGDSISGVEALINKFFTNCSVPSWYEMSAELTFLQSAFYLQMISKLDAYNVYLKLPTELFTGESFGDYEEIVHWGHRHGKSAFQGFDPRSPFPLVWARLNQFADPCYQLEPKREIYRKSMKKRKKETEFDGDEFDTYNWNTEIFGERFSNYGTGS